MAGYVIGIDGGGTKTLGAIADLEGRVLAQHEVGSSNPHSNSLDVVRDNLKQLSEELMARVGASAGDVESICLGMAGVDRPEDKPMVIDMVHGFLPLAKVTPVNDGVIALMGGALKPIGIIVISGTGSIAFGINEKGERARAGGWGHILGDEGSGYSLALKGLRAVCRAHDGRTGPTRLREIILSHFGFDRPEQLMGWTRDIQGSKAEIAGLSRLVHQAHEEGDVIAARIAREESHELAITAKAVAAKLFEPGKTDWEVIVAGGNLRKSDSFFDLFRQDLAGELPGISVMRPKKEPVEGAVLLALENRVEA